MLTKRIIPCLDIKDGRAVKGVNFMNLKDAGDPVKLARRYSDDGADELVFLDITATKEKRKTLSELVNKIAQEVNIPFTVGGGVSTASDAYLLLQAGADKICINTAAVKTPSLIKELSMQFGSQCVVLAVDAKEIDGRWKVHLIGGQVVTDIDLFEWAKEAEQLGAGEILFTSMNSDGTKNGFANDALSTLSDKVRLPVIASGGAGKKEHFRDTFINGKADGALAASIFHFGELSIPDLKKYLINEKIKIRI